MEEIRRPRLFCKIVCLVAGVVHLAFASESKSDVALQKASQHAQAFNWSDAGPEFYEAEQMFRAVDDRRNAVFAHVGWLRGTMESHSLIDVQRELQELIKSETVKSDEHLLLFACIAKADVDGELNALTARQDWLTIEKLATKLQDQLWMNRAKGEQSLAEFLTGNISKGRVLIATALAGARKQSDFAAQIRYTTAIGTAFQQAKRYDEALEYLDKALLMARQQPVTGYPFVTLEYKIDALLGSQRLSEAEKLAGEVIAEARKRQKKVKEAQALFTLARINERKGDLESAIKYLLQADQLAAIGHFQRFQADAQFRLADLYRSQGNIRAAEERLNRGLLKVQGTSELWLMPARLQALAELKIADRHYKEADQIYHRAADLVDALIGSTTKPEAERSLVATNSDIYVSHFELAVNHLNNVNDEYRAVEGARGRTALDMLRGVLSSRTTAKSASVDDSVSRLRQQLSVSKSERQRLKLKEALFEEEQLRWTTDISSDQRLKRAASIVPLSRVKRSLGIDEAILEYVIGEQTVYCLVITQRSARTVRLASKETVETAIKAHLQAIKDLDPGKSTGRSLYSLLIEPIEEAVNRQKLIIIRDGQTNLVPWDALVDSSGHYLVERQNISFAPSVSTAFLLRQRSLVKGGSTLLAVGGLPYGRLGGAETVFRGSSTTTKLNDIPGARDEVTDAAKVFRAQDRKVSLLLDSDATKAAFKQAVRGEFEIVHLAVHALADEKNPGHAALFLLSDKQTGTDGRLDEAEVLSLQLKTNCVVLSACQSAVGRLEGQEGIAALSRAFLLAGSNSTVSTLWQIDDTFSRFLIGKFYQRIAAGATVSDALREAKLNLIQTFGSKAVPYRWAAYVLEGADNTRIPRS